MARGLRTMKGWMSWRNGVSFQWVFYINVGVALASGIAAVVALKVSFAVGALIAGGTLVGLTASLLHRRLSLIAAVAGSTLVGLVIGLIGLVLGGPGSVASWVGAILAGSAGFAPTFWVYRRLVRSTTGAGDLEGRYTGTFNERDVNLRKGSGAATVVVSATDAADHDLLIAGLVVGGVPVDLYGKRREDAAVIADLSKARSTAAPCELLRGKAMLDGAMLIVDLEGSPFGSYVFTGQRQPTSSSA